jgi:hypothetical protein
MRFAEPMAISPKEAPPEAKGRCSTGLQSFPMIGTEGKDRPKQRVAHLVVPQEKSPDHQQGRGLEVFP